MSRGLSVSVGLHVLAFVAVLVGPAPKAFEWDMETVPVELVAPLDVLEDKTPEALPEPEPDPTPPVIEKLPEVEPVVEPPPEEPKPKPQPVKPPPKKVRPPRKFQRVAPKRADDEPSLAERLQQRMDQTKPAEPAESTVQPVTPPRSTATQPVVDAADFPYAWYLNQVQTLVRDSWDTPGDRLILGHANQVVVRAVIHRDGRATDVTVEAGSGTPGLDTSARRAVERAQPFPPLPEPYEGDTLDLTVRFTVSGEDR